jgi:hypothetical protein
MCKVLGMISSRVECEEKRKGESQMDSALKAPVTEYVIDES